MIDVIADSASLMAFTGKRRIWVAGHRGMVGSAILRRLAGENVDVLTVGRDELDLREQAAVRTWIARGKPDVIILGGRQGRRHPRQ